MRHPSEPVPPPTALQRVISHTCTVVFTSSVSYMNASPFRAHLSTNGTCTYESCLIYALLYMRVMSHIKPCLTNRLNIAYIHPSP